MKQRVFLANVMHDMGLKTDKQQTRLAHILFSATSRVSQWASHKRAMSTHSKAILLMLQDPTTRQGMIAAIGRAIDLELELK